MKMDINREIADLMDASKKINHYFRNASKEEIIMDFLRYSIEQNVDSMPPEFKDCCVKESLNRITNAYLRVSEEYKK